MAYLCDLCDYTGDSEDMEEHFNESHYRTKLDWMLNVTELEN